MSSYIIRVSNGRKTIYKFRHVFREHGFEFHERSYGRSFYEREITNDGELQGWAEYCRRRRLRCDIIPKEYTRSATYRNTFFKKNRPVRKGRYRCVYCGRLLKRKDVTVDHIFPVNQMMYSGKVRGQARRHGVTETNCVQNLVSACKSCNSMKGTKTGKWVVKAYLGKHELYWWIVRVVQAVLFIVAAVLLYNVFHSFGSPSSFLSRLFHL